jgi:hypothetical protein
MANETLCTPAWLLVGLTRSVPGVLELVDDDLAFTTDDGRLFDVPLAEVRDVEFPWYYFGGGVKLRVGAERFRLSFVRPNDASDLEGRLLARSEDGGAAALLTAGRKVLDIGDGRRAGRAWKRVLTARA